MRTHIIRIALAGGLLAFLAGAAQAQTKLAPQPGAMSKDVPLQGQQVAVPLVPPAYVAHVPVKIDDLPAKLLRLDCHVRQGAATVAEGTRQFAPAAGTNSYEGVLEINLAATDNAGTAGPGGRIAQCRLWVSLDGANWREPNYGPDIPVWYRVSEDFTQPDPDHPGITKLTLQ